MTQDNEKKSKSGKAEIIDTVQTPLGFFTLVVLIVEAVFLILLPSSQNTEHLYLIIAMIGIIFLLVLIVAVFAFYRPEALSGRRPNNKSPEKVEGLLPTTSTDKEKAAQIGLSQVYASIQEASEDIVTACKEAESIRILANKGIVFVGTDESLISTAEIASYKGLKKIRVILMSKKSRWINKGFISLRKHESLETYIHELEASHQIVETGVNKFILKMSGTGSGVKYFTREPSWRIIMTEKVAFVSNYADEQNPQVRDIPVCRFENTPSSYYTAFKRQFDNLWHNESAPSEAMKESIDFSISAGGIVYANIKDNTYVILLKRHDGFWVLPKGHKKKDDGSIEVAAVREVSEESGISISLLVVERLLEIYNDTKYEHKVVHLFSIRYLGNELPNLKPDIDHVEAKWWLLSDDFPVMLYPYQAATLEEFKENLLRSKSTN